MIKCIAVDDEPLALQKMKKYIGQIPTLELVALCSGTREAREVIAREVVDLIFLDINMPDESGMVFAKSLLGAGPAVVFTTAYPEFALEGYKVEALDYMLKPFDFADFEQVVARVQKRLEAESVAEKEYSSDSTIFIKTDYKIRPIKVADIRYAESMGEYLHIYVEREPKPIVTLLSMKKIEEKLPRDLFMRIHRSFIINLDKVYAISKMRVMMDEDTSISVGDVYKDRINAYIAEKSIK